MDAHLRIVDVKNILWASRLLFLPSLPGRNFAPPTLPLTYFMKL